jgi:hypothetical protein
MFIVEWVSLFLIGWLFWSLMFFSAPGSVPPGLAATIVSVLYASGLVYGRLRQVTGCRKCASPLPLLRQEIGRRHMPDEENCVELEFGGSEWDQHFVHVYCRVLRTDFVTFRCRKCDQMWEEKIELPGSSYKLVRRLDLKKTK